MMNFLCLRPTTWHFHVPSCSFCHIFSVSLWIGYGPAEGGGAPPWTPYPPPLGPLPPLKQVPGGGGVAGAQVSAVLRFALLRIDLWDPWATRTAPVSAGACDGLDFVTAASAELLDTSVSGTWRAAISTLSGGAFTVCVEATPRNWESEPLLISGPADLVIAENATLGTVDVAVHGLELVEGDRCGAQTRCASVHRGWRACNCGRGGGGGQ